MPHQLCRHFCAWNHFHESEQLDSGLISFQSLVGGLNKSHIVWPCGSSQSLHPSRLEGSLSDSRAVSNY
jgi:hypothetical protein